MIKIKKPKQEEKVVIESVNSELKSVVSDFNLDNFIGELMFFCIQIKIFHWNTHNGFLHKTLDSCHSEMLDLIDRFVEASIGREVVIMPNCDRNLVKYTESNLNDVLNYTKNNLEEIKITNQGLLTILGEIIELINKTIYLSARK